MRYLITGGAGFIGSHLAENLIARGDNVLVLDNFSTGSEVNLANIRKKIDVERVDLSQSLLYSSGRATLTPALDEAIACY